MSATRPLAVALTFFVAVEAALVALGPRSSPADTIVLKNGIVYRGTIDRDNTILWVYDGLKRVILRDSKVERIVGDTYGAGGDEFGRLPTSGA